MKIKSYLAKLVIVAMSITTVFATPLYAAEQKPMLKLEDVIKSAIGYSNQVTINSKNYNLLVEQIKLNNSPDYYAYQMIYLRKAQSEQQKKILEDQIASDITKKYTDMVILEKEIQVIQKNIAISTRVFKEMKLRNSKGLINPIQYQSKENELTNLNMNKTAKEEEFKNAKAYFRVITGRDVNNYTLDDNISYEPFRVKGSAESYISSKIDEYLKYSKEIAELNGNNPFREGEAAPEYGLYLSRKTDAEVQALGLEDQQKSLQQGLINSYSSMFSIEDDINSLKLKLDILDRELKVADIRYKAGLISALEYDKNIVAKEEVQIKRLQLVSSYNTLKDSIQKPWVMGSNQSQQSEQ